MGFKSQPSQQSVDTATTPSSVTQQTQTRSQSTDVDHSGVTAAQAKQQYGLDISSRTELHEIQRLEQTHGQKVHDWVDEGIPPQAMGSPAKMRAFRKRKNTPVPWNVEARNEQSVQRSATAAADTSPAGDTGVPDSVREVILSTGQSLDGSIQRLMEDEMGGSFDDVQVHTGASAANACESINARAFTVGNHVAFNHGEYDPSSPAGQHVIAHELAHVRQQTGGAVSMLPQEGLELEIDPDPQLEREAEETAQRVMQGSALGVQRLSKTSVHVQRAPRFVSGDEWDLRDRERERTRSRTDRRTQLRTALQTHPGEWERRLTEWDRQDRRREEVFSDLEHQASTPQGVAEAARQLESLDQQENNTIS